MQITTLIARPVLTLTVKCLINLISIAELFIEYFSLLVICPALRHIRNFDNSKT